MTTFLFRRTRRGAEAAFTLIELLVSMTVLVLLIVAVSQIVSGTTSVSTANRQHLDADGQARLVFDRMALDFARMLKRQDVDYIFKDTQSASTHYSLQTGDDRFFFYTEAPAFFDTTVTASAQSPLSLVGYRIDASTTAAQKNPQLSRLGKGLAWDESSGPSPGTNEPMSIAFLTPFATPLPSPLPVPSPTPIPTPFASTTFNGRWPKTVGAPGYESDTSAAASYHVIADQVCRMEICFLLKPRAVPAQPARYSVDPYYDPAGTAGSQHAAINGLQDVQAIVVALAVLDRTSRERVTDLSHMKTVLADISNDDLTALPPRLIAKVWQDKINSDGFAAEAQIPRSVASQVRVYQRHFYLDTH